MATFDRVAVTKKILPRPMQLIHICTCNTRGHLHEDGHLRRHVTMTVHAYLDPKHVCTYMKATVSDTM